MTDDPVDRALWRIEHSLGGEIALDDVAAAAGVSRFSLSRRFAWATGVSVMRYVRNRRLSIAARALAGGAPDILQVALDAGYASHEAFSRAFRDLFGQTPESVRAGGVDALTLTEPMRMRTQTAELSQPEFRTGPALVLVGLKARYAQGGDAGIPVQWQTFAGHLGAIPGEIPGVRYGVGASFDDEGAFDYLTAVAVTRVGDLAPALTVMRLPERSYAVFTHRGHVAAIPHSMRAIWTQWLPGSGREIAEAPFFERYDSRFDPATGDGEIELWLPVT